MATNVFFNHAVNSEQHLYEDLVVESLRMYGHETMYLPRQVIEEDSILNEDVQSKFGDAYSVEMYIENTDGFEGEGDLMSKFGLQIRDQATFVISLRSWERFISLDSNLATSFRPNEGDLIYFPLSGSMFEIKFVEHEEQTHIRQKYTSPLKGRSANFFSWLSLHVNFSLIPIGKAWYTFLLSKPVNVSPTPNSEPIKGNYAWMISI